MPFSRFLALPFAIGAVIFAYLAWEKSEKYAVYIIPLVVILSVIYTLSPQIDWWWYKKKPPKMDARFRLLLEKHSSFYQHLGEADKLKFQDRIELYKIAKDFISPDKEQDQIPEDIKGWIAAQAVMLTLGQNDFLLPKFERIVVYARPFITPQFPQYFHASEIYVEDGVLLLAAEQFLLGVLQPKQYYNIGLHEYARIFVLHYPTFNYPIFDEHDLQKISGFSYEWIKKGIGLPDVELLPIAIHHFFSFPERFSAVLPDEYGQLSYLFSRNYTHKNHSKSP